MHPTELEAIVQRQVRRLPAPQAPHTLLPRVMAAVRTWSERPWYQRAWMAWPAGWQVASAAALILTVAGILALAPFAQGTIDFALARMSAAASDRLSILTAVLNPIAVLVRVLWRVVIEPAAPFAFLVMLLIGLTFSVLGGLLDRLIAQEVRQP